jgi:hypothetical protein
VKRRWKGLPFLQPLHPSFLWLIRNVVQAGKTIAKNVSICGEMAGNPIYFPLLFGLGLREFSVAPIAIREIKEMAQTIMKEEACQPAGKALDLDSPQEILHLLKASLRADWGRTIPELTMASELDKLGDELEKINLPKALRSESRLKMANHQKGWKNWTTIIKCSGLIKAPVRRRLRKRFAEWLLSITPTITRRTPGKRKKISRRSTGPMKCSVMEPGGGSMIF